VGKRGFQPPASLKTLPLWRGSHLRPCLAALSVVGR